MPGNSQPRTRVSGNAVNAFAVALNTNSAVVVAKVTVLVPAQTGSLHMCWMKSGRDLFGEIRATSHMKHDETNNVWQLEAIEVALAKSNEIQRRIIYEKVSD